MVRTYFLYNLLLVLLPAFTVLYSREDSLSLFIESGFTLGKGENLPFHLQSGRFDLITNQSGQLYTRYGVSGSFSENRKFDLAWGLTMASNLNGQKNSIYAEEYYGTLKWYFIQLKAGAKRRIFREYNYQTGSGDIIWSGNCRPVPGIEISSDGYTIVPFTFGWLNINGGISNSWLSDIESVEDVMLHHKWLRFKSHEDFPFLLRAGMDHFAQWGGRSDEWGDLPRDFEAFRKVFFAKGGLDSAPETEGMNAIGNHLGSMEVGLFYKMKTGIVGLDWRSFFEDKSGGEWDNYPDGLYSLSYQSNNKNSMVSEILFEWVLTDHQSGPPGIDTTGNHPPPGNDNYFNHGIYLMGWTERGRTIGTPFITSPLYGERTDIVNNRVRVFHAGVAGGMGQLKYSFSYSRMLSKGTYQESFSSIKKDKFFLLSFSMNDLIFANSMVEVDLSIDRGQFYGNNYGLMFTFIKNWKVKSLF